MNFTLKVPDDDYLHDVEEASNFNESAYYNFYDAGVDLGGWVRLGNRPNEGHAEMTVCLYLPDGRVAFWFARPPIPDNTAHAAGGLRFDVLTAFKEHRVTYTGPVVVLAEPSAMEDPKAAFAENPHAECYIELIHRAISEPWGGVPDQGSGEVERDPEKMFFRGHFEQHMAVTGTITVGDETFRFTDGLGLRDHSWGPRYWQNIWWYRWLTGNLGPDLGFAATVSGTEDGGRRTTGYVYDGLDGNWTPVTEVDLRTDYDDRWYQRAVRATIRTEEGGEYEVEGEVRSLIPLRNRRDGRTTRITEGMTIWRTGNRVGSGLTEYLDQVVEGRPVGVEK